MSETANADLARLFAENARAVGAGVLEAKNLEEALALALKVTREKTKAPDSGGAANAPKTLFLADVPDELYRRFEETAGKEGILVGRDLAGDFGEGPDAAFSVALFGISETGTAVLRFDSDDSRAAALLCEIQVVALGKSSLVPGFGEAEPKMTEIMRETDSRLVMVTGPSRTSDIERVLTLGAHGPLELLVVLTED
ncbi:MAG: lactate utilization protein [Deltaproteobacteria bacterium]|jgi:L-lactate dehydrogenase complex protein LldG|nr:lactate utilization protein [Deltaproteobacteria bacterium]